MAAFDLADWLCPDAPNGRQPQGAYAINDDHPLARSLIYALHGGEVGRTSMASIMKRSIGPFGAQIGVSSAGYSGDPVVVKDIKAAQCAGLAEYSIFVIFSRVSGPTSSPTIFAETTSGGYARNMFYYNGGWVWRTRDNTSGDTGSPDELSVVSPVSGAYEKRLFTYGKGAKKAYLNGVLSNSKSLTTSGFTATDSVGFAVNGALDNSNTSYGGDSKVALLYMFNRVLTADEARLLSNDPYALLGSPLKSVFLGAAAGGGSTLNASASGGDVASGSASLSAQVALASVGVSAASGSATLAASVPLSAVGLSVAAGSATPSATVTISASGLAQAAGQAGLSASVLAQAAGAALASGNATLAAQLNALATGAAQAGGSANLSGGAAGSLSASGAAIAAGTAVLSVTVGLQAAGSALASGTATGSANAPGQVSATGGATAGGSGVMSARVSITAAGFVQAMGQGSFSATVPLSAFGAVTASGYAHLTVDNGVVMVRAPSGYRSSLIAYNSTRPRQSITIRPISLNTRR